MTGSSTDLLRWPVIGRFLRWRHARTSLQLPLLAVAVVLVLHGWFGPQVAPANLATVVTWVQYRGLLIVALLAAGNLFCTACPMVLARDAGRRLRAPRLTWPRRWRTKWLAAGLVGAVLFTYEFFDLWALPSATAWLIAGYFAAAIAIDLTFTGASFCKYLCPVGQFSFITSTMAPFELRVRRMETCRACATADCIRGRRTADAPRAVGQRGCELALFLPSKVGNLDCTLCLDCVHACPHDNISLASRVPGLELVESRRRSGIGRLARRRDFVALVVVFVFGAFVNAFAMTAPAVAVEQRLLAAGVASPVLRLGLVFCGVLVAAPAVLLGGAAWCTARLAGLRSWREPLVTFAYALVPLGVAVWLAHYGFHWLTGLLTVIPVTQSAAWDLFDWPVLGVPRWQWTGLRPGVVYPLQIGVTMLGAVGSAAIAYLIAEREHPARARRAAAPWIAVAALLAAAAMWIFSQPMDMRAVGMAG